MLTLRWLDLPFVDCGRGIRTVADGERSGLAGRTEIPGATTVPPIPSTGVRSTMRLTFRFLFPATAPVSRGEPRDDDEGPDGGAPMTSNGFVGEGAFAFELPTGTIGVEGIVSTVSTDNGWSDSGALRPRFS